MQGVLVKSVIRVGTAVSGIPKRTACHCVSLRIGDVTSRASMENFQAGFGIGF